MKILFCPSCHDVHGLVMNEWRMCLCGLSGGQYNKDGMTATIGGEARIFGVGNPFFDYLYPFLEEKGKKEMWRKYYGHEMGDCWWGEYKGDLQLFRIKSATGPRLKIEVKIVDKAQMNVIIVDKRDYTVSNLGKIPFVTVPQNPNVKLTRWNAKPKKVKVKLTEEERKEAAEQEEFEKKFDELVVTQPEKK